MISKKFQQEFSKLNKEQKEAVEAIEGPVMVIAGPGTGKTQILAMRIANILNETQVNPSNILALTFTNSGVYAMRKRLLDIVGKASYAVHIHTFHSFCNDIIQTFPEKFLFAQKINQLTDLEQIKLIQKIIDKKDLEFLKPLKAPYYYQTDILKAINDLKQEGIGPENFTRLLSEPRQEDDKKQHSKNLELVEIYEAYQKALQKEGLYDYSDMILFVTEKLKSDAELLSHYQEKFQYILIDEYQDTNSAQNEIVTILGSFYPDPNIFVVGDDEQSIFRFQGASLENILNFKGTYPDAKMIILDKNYRSGQKILDASRALIKNNLKQIFQVLKIEKNLKSQVKNIKGEIFTGEFSSGEVENYFVAKKIQELIKKGTKPSEIAVIYKQHRDGEELIDTLAKLNIPYQLEIGGNVLDDVEIQKIIKILKVIAKPFADDTQPLIFEILHYPFFNIDSIDLYKISSLAYKARANIFDILQKDEKFKEFLNTIFKCAESFQTKTFAEAFEETINSTGYLEYLLSLPESVNHLNRLQSLFEEIKIINTKNKNLTLEKFLDYLDDLEKNNLQIKERELDINLEAVKFMTAHKSKGLEFEYVFIIRCIEKHWGESKRRQLIKLPSGFLRTSVSDDNSEEERRLFYVAMTRTKKEIYITYALKYSDSQTVHLPSMFLNELPPKHLQKIKTDFFEKQFGERIKLKFAPKLWKPHKALKEFLADILKDFYLSPTSLSNYLNCPLYFYYNHLLRVPQVKTFSQSYGTAIHKALEQFMRKFQRDFELPKKEYLINFYEKALEAEILSEADFKRAIPIGRNHLKSYYDFNKAFWAKSGPPLNVEYNFGSHHVHFNHIPITGKIDKIEMLDSIGNKVKITDYKTMQPISLNQILGKTKAEETSELYQTFFYKLLAENDPQFKWKISEIEFDFLSPKNGKFIKVNVPIDDKQYQEFRELVKNTYGDILKLKFDSTTDNSSCQKFNKKCEFFDLCNNKK
ncbi:MAG: ATP-dependent DNA helicase [Candidatus Berkelbacteria bacterium]|nr:ATP-dependent DNA helicase [Candidatus Berkelbacteria bacterium]